MEINIHLCSSGTIIAGNFFNILIMELSGSFLLEHAKILFMKNALT